MVVASAPHLDADQVVIHEHRCSNPLPAVPVDWKFHVICAVLLGRATVLTDPMLGLLYHHVNAAAALHRPEA